MSDPLQHTRGGSTTKDATDMGVPMQPAPHGWTPQAGPEDALDPSTPKRGDYRGRIGDTEHVQVEAHRSAWDAPAEVRSVPQNAAAGDVVLADDGGPLDAADPNYERLLEQRRRLGILRGPAK